MKMQMGKVEIRIPDSDPAKRICRYCKKPGAQKWDGGETSHYRWNAATQASELVIHIEYCCVDCDINNKWFGLSEEDFRQR
jgi:hypothetical protein